MKLKEAMELMEKDKACAERAMECFEDGIPCGGCKYYADPDKLDEARWTALRVMQAWKSAKEEIKKTCGCSTAYDIMEKYEKEGGGNMNGITYSTVGSFGAFRSIRPGEYPYTEARLKRHKMEEPDIEEEEENDEDEPDRTERSRILRAVGRYIQTQHEEHGLSALGVNGTVYAVEDILKELDAIIREEEGEA